MFVIWFFLLIMYNKSHRIIANRLTQISTTIPFKYRGMPNMNQGKPLKLDVVIVYDQSLLSILNNLTAQQYYESRENLYASNKHLMTIATWDIQPGKVSPNYDLMVGYNPICILVYANYDNPDNNHKLVIPVSTSHIMILLNEKTLISPDNGIDYMNLGKNKEFQILEMIKDNVAMDKESIPNGLDKFYKINDANPMVLTEDEYQFDPLKIDPVSNEPLRLENLSPVTKNSSIIDQDFVVPYNTSWGQILINHLGNYTFSLQGILSDNIIINHGIAIIESYHLNQKNYEAIVTSFHKKKYFYIMVLNDFFEHMEIGRNSPLEIKKFQGGNGSNGENNGINVNGNDSNNGRSGSLGNNSNNINNSDGNNGVNINNNGKNPGDNGNNSKSNNPNGNNPNGSSNDKNNPNGNNKNGSGFNFPSPSMNQNSSNNNNNNPDYNNVDNNKSPKDYMDKEHPSSPDKPSNPSSDPVNPKKPINYLPSAGNLKGISSNLSFKWKWLSLIKKLNNGVNAVKKVKKVKYV